MREHREPIPSPTHIREAMHKTWIKALRKLPHPAVRICIHACARPRIGDQSITDTRVKLNYLIHEHIHARSL